MIQMTHNEQYTQALRDAVSESIGKRAKALRPCNITKKDIIIMLVDCETVNKGRHYPYEIAIKFYKNGKLIEEKSFIIADIFDNEYEMQNAWYKNKIPFYNETLLTNENMTKKSAREILQNLNELISKYKMKNIYAYNAIFDRKAINNLYELPSNSDIPNLFKRLYVVDIWKIATDIITLFDDLYDDFMLFCYRHRLYTTKQKSISTSAETIAKYVYQNPYFVEEHTGIADTVCEFDILTKMLQIYKKKTGCDYYYKLDSVGHDPKPFYAKKIQNVFERQLGY